MNKKSLIISVLVLILIVIGVMYYLQKKNGNDASDFEVTQEEIPKNQNPQGFESDFPVEAGATVLQNFEAKTEDGRVQSTKVLSTKNSLTEAVQIYSSYFASKGWAEIPSDSSNEENISVVLRKNDDLLLIKGKTNSDNTLTTVEVSLTQAKL